MKLIVSLTISVTPQEERVSDAHCVVDIQIQLQITDEISSDSLI